MSGVANTNPGAVKYDRIALYLLAVIRTQQDRIKALEELKADNQLLKQRLDALERRTKNEE